LPKLDRSLATEPEQPVRSAYPPQGDRLAHDPERPEEGGSLVELPTVPGFLFTPYPAPAETFV